MRSNDLGVPYEPFDDGSPSRAAPRGDVTRQDFSRADASLGDLFKRLTSDTGELIRQEAALAKAEIRETGAALLNDVRGLAIAAVLALIGGLVLVAFLVIGLGILLGHRYWLSSLIVGVAALGTGAVLARTAMNDFKTRSLLPKQTLDTLRDDKTWAAQQARELSHELTSEPSHDTIRPSAGR